MASRDPHELRRELRSIDGSGDAATLSELRNEAHETVQGQRETLSDVDSKASKILRLNIVLIGILVSAASIVAQNGEADGLSSLDSFVNAYTSLGVGALVLSTAFAALTYTASEVDVGVSSENLTDLLRADFSRDDVEELLVKNYVMRINFNRSTNVRNIPLIQLTIFLAVGAVVFFTLGVYEAIAGSPTRWMEVVAWTVLLAVVLASGLPTQLGRAARDVRIWR